MRWAVLLLVVLLSAITALPSPAGADRGAAFRAVAARIEPAVVIVHATRDGPGDREKRTRSGLGVLVDPKGVVVLPRRLVQGADRIEVVLHDGRKLRPKSTFADAKAEVAALTLPLDRPAPCAEFGDSGEVKVGDMVLSLDLGFRREIAFERGIISCKRRQGCGERFLMDSARSYPSDRDILLNSRGEVIGIWTTTGAVPAGRAQKAFRRLLEK